MAHHFLKFTDHIQKTGLFLFFQRSWQSSQWVGVLVLDAANGYQSPPNDGDEYATTSIVAVSTLIYDSKPF
jgi:hypothetical protein